MSFRFGLSKNKKQTQFRSPQLASTKGDVSKPTSSLPSTLVGKPAGAVDSNLPSTSAKAREENSLITSQRSSQDLRNVAKNDAQVLEEEDDEFLAPSQNSRNASRNEKERDISVIRSSDRSEVYQQPAVLQELQTTLLEDHGAPVMSSTPIPGFNFVEPEPKRPRLSSSFTTVPGVSSGNRNSDSDNVFANLKPVSFAELCQECGFYLNTNSRNELRVDQAVFQKRLISQLNRGFNPELNLKDFLEDTKEALMDKNLFHNAMLPTVTAPGCPARNAEQDSLVRLLLHVKQFQSRFMNYLLDRFLELVNDPGFTHRDADLPRMILSQLSCLNEVEEPKLFTEKILNVLKRVTTWAQRDIITALPGIVVDESCMEIVFALCEMLDSKPELFASLLDTMENLEIPPMEASKLRMNVLDKVTATPLGDLSALLKFLLSDLPAHESDEVVNSLRESLNSALITNQTLLQPMKSGLPATQIQSDADLVLLVVDNLFTLLRNKKELNIAWMKAIKEDDEKVNAIDLVVLVLLHGITGKKRVVESLLRNMLRTGNLNENILQSTNEVLAPIWRKYVTRIIPLADTLLQSPEPVISAFGIVLYKTLYLSCLGIGRIEVVTALMEHVGKTGSDNGSCASVALGTLCDLAKGHRRAMCHCGMLLVNLLDLLDCVTLLQAKKIMEILAVLAYDENGQEDRNSAAVVQSLQVTITKQLYQAKIQYKRFGVLGGVASLRAMASPTINLQFSGDNDRRETDINSADDLTRRALKKPLELLETLFKTTEQFPEAYELLMDELTYAAFNGDFHLQMVEYLKDQLACRFETLYIIDRAPENETLTLADLKFKTELEVELQEPANIIINIGPLVARTATASATSQESHFIRALCSMFRLLRFVTEATDGNLDAIDALLGAPVLCPALELLEPERFIVLEEQEKTVVVVSVIYVISWFIELIGGFVMQKETEISLKVSKRLAQVVGLRKKLFECLEHQGSFIPPLSKYFGTVDAQVEKLWLLSTKKRVKKKSARKKGKKGGEKKATDTQPSMSLATVSQTMVATCGTSALQEADQAADIVKPDVKILNWKLLRKLFREVDLDVCVLLTRPLKLRPEDDNEDSIKNPIDPDQMHWLLEDYVAKVERRFVVGAPKRRFLLGAKKSDADDAEFAFLDQVVFEVYVEKCCCYVPKLCEHLELLFKHFKDVLNDEDRTTDESPVLAQNCGFILQALTRILSWNGFRDSQNPHLLKGALAGLARRMDVSVSANSSREDLNQLAVDFLLSFQDVLPDFAIGIQFITCLEAVVKLKPFHLPTRQLLVDCAIAFLKRQWVGFIPGTGTNPGVEQLLKMYFAYVEDPRPTIKDVAAELKSVALSRTGEATSDKYCTLSKISSNTYYRCMFWALVNDVQALGSKKKLQLEMPSGSQLGPDEWLQTWQEAVDVLSDLVGVVHVRSRRSIFAICLKYAKMFVDLFTKCAMPGLDQLLRTKTEASTRLIKSLQTSTRVLHRICNDTKLNSDALTATQVPGVKKTLETFVYRIQAAYAKNKCASACLVANLRNKDLTGKEILSQGSRQDSDESGDEEQVLPDDDESDVALDEDEIRIETRAKARQSRSKKGFERPDSAQSSHSGTGTNVSRSPDLPDGTDSDEEAESVSKVY